MARDDAPTYEELVETVATLTALVDELRAEIAGLRARLGENSSNSSKPPSSDGYTKPTRQQRRSGERKAGKQKGVPGSHLSQVLEPDEIVTHVPDRCESCQGELSGADVEGVERRQVFDIPPMDITVTEHQSQSLRCACGTVTAASFPNGVDSPALYGLRIRALASYLVVFQHLPYDRTRQLFCDVLGVDLSPATILAAVREAAANLDGFGDEVRRQLREQSVVHFDETGARVAGKLHWVHSASTPLLTDYLVHTKRGTAAMDDAKVLADMAGIAIHDGWKPYRNYDVAHGLCNAHHLRELASTGEVWNQQWALDMTELLISAKNKVQAAKEQGHEALSGSALHGIRCRYGALIAQGQRANPKRERRKQTKAYNLIVRLDMHRNDVLRFATDFRVPFDNNQAERDIRMVKLQQKISGCWRTLAGARAYLAVRAYISTARKQGHNALEVLRRLFEGDPWMPVPQPT